MLSQVTASSLYILPHKAYTFYNALTEDNEERLLSREGWCGELFWFTALQLELQVIIFVRSLREADIKMYIHSISKIVSWFFALDHCHYARWLPVHLRDMVSLNKKHPTIYKEFLSGNFTVMKCERVFSNIASNAYVKGDEGANTEPIRRTAVDGVSARDDSSHKRISNLVSLIVDTMSTQATFFNQVTTLTSVIDLLGNIFTDDSNNLLVLIQQ